MTLKDFFALFNILISCKLFPDDSWHCIRRKGFFVERGGGCVNYASWPQNEQFLLDVEDDCEIFFTLTQKDSLYHKDQLKSALRPAIGIVVHKHNFGDINLENTPKLLSMKSVDIITQTSFTDARNVKCTGKFKIGRYAVLPSTFDVNCGGEYFLSVYSKMPVNLYGGIEVDWDPNMLDKNIEGDNEIEQNLTKVLQEEEEVREVDTENLAVGLAAKMVTNLTIQARQLSARKEELQHKLDALHVALDDASQ